MPRDVNGQYELPAGNPVVSGTIISTNWANDTMSDLANALTNSLSRNGNGGMLAPFLNADGSQSAPGISWANEPSMGLWREGAQDMRLGVSGAPTQRWNDQGSQLWRNSQWEEILTQTGGGGDTTINNLVVTGSFTSPGIDDNATSTAITIDANENVSIGTASAFGLITVGSPDGNNFLAVDCNNTNGAEIQSYSGDLTINRQGNDTILNPTTGNVGIGSTSPDAALEVHGDVGADLQTNRTAIFRHPNTNQGAIEIRNGRGDVSLPERHSSIQAWSNELVATSALVLNPEGGNVGIGTSDPDSELEVEGKITVSTTGDSRKGSIYSTGGGLFIGSEGANGLTAVVFNKYGGTEAMRIDSSGNVGIGTDDPQKELEVHSDGTTQVRLVGGDTGGAILNFGSSAVPADGRIVYSNVSKLMQFRTNNGAYSFNITSTGNVGIGTDAPGGKLTVRSTASASSDSHFGFGASNDIYLTYGDSGDCIWRTVSGAGANVERMRINSSGDVLVGTDTSEYSANNRKVLQLLGGSGGSILALKSPTADFYIQALGTSADVDVVNRGNGGIKFYTNNTERMRIDSSGNLLVGRTSTSASFTDYGAQVYSNGVIFQFGQSNGNDDLHRWHNGNGNQVAWLTGAGNFRASNITSRGMITQDGAPVIDAKGLISTLATLRQATMDDTQDIRESLRSAIDELITGFEQEIATMPAPEVSTKA